MKKLLPELERLVIPSETTQRSKGIIAKKALSLVKSESVKHAGVKSVELGGSFAKDTWLKEKADIDIFIKFDPSVSEKSFTIISKTIGFESMKDYNPYVRYSDHPYVEAQINRTKVNVVPCYDVKKGLWKSAADRSSYHTKFMSKNLSKKMKDDVRILKSFFLKNDLYGAEIAKQGFSGYVAEVLIWNFGSFKKTVQAFSKIKSYQTIGNPAKKFDTIITITDPIDPNRNLAAAISEENVGKFVLLCRALLAKPSLKFFKKRSRRNKKNIQNCVVVKFNYAPRSPDIIWGQIKRAVKALTVQLEMGGFVVLKSDAYCDEKNEAYLMFLLQSLTISESIMKEGPEFFDNEDSKKFIFKNRKNSSLMWVGKNRKLRVLAKRKHTAVSSFLGDLFANQIDRSGVPKGIKDDIKNYKIIRGNKILTQPIKLPLSDLTSTNERIFHYS